MNINFEELEKQELNYRAILTILESLYNDFNKTTSSTIKLNEYVDTVNKVTGKSDEFYFELINNPISISDTLIVLDDGTKIITPSSIIKIENGVVFIKSADVSTESAFFVTYKY